MRKEVLVFLGLLLSIFYMVDLCLAQNASYVLQKEAKTSFADKLAPKPGSATSKGLSLDEEIPDWQARWELARVLSYVQRYKESIAQYKRLLQEKPDLQKARLEMARVMYWSGHIDEAQKYLESVPVGDLKPEARLDLADIYVAQKKYPQAKKIYSQFLKNHPQNDAVRLKLARVLSWMSNYEDSLEHYKLLVQHKPEDIQLKRQYAQVLIWAGKYEQAIKELRGSFND